MSQGETDIGGRIGYAAKRLQQALRTAADQRLRPIGLTMPQYAALSAMDSDPGLSNSELARRCFVTRQTMNEVLSGLEQRGLISRAAHPSDARVRRIDLTAEAREVLHRGHRAVEAVEDKMTAALDETECRTLYRMLVSCADSLEAEI